MSKLDNFKIDYSDTWESVKDKLNGVIDYCAEYFDNKMNNSTNGIITESDGVTEKLYLVNPENVKIVNRYINNGYSFDPITNWNPSFPSQQYINFEPNNKSTILKSQISNESDINTIDKALIAITAITKDNYTAIFRTNYLDDSRDTIEYIIELVVTKSDGTTELYSLKKKNTLTTAEDLITNIMFKTIYRTMHEYNMRIITEGQYVKILVEIPYKHPAPEVYSVGIIQFIFNMSTLTWTEPNNQEVAFEYSDVIFNNLIPSNVVYLNQIIDYCEWRTEKGSDEIHSAIISQNTTYGTESPNYILNLGTYNSVDNTVDIVPSGKSSLSSRLPPKVFCIKDRLFIITTHIGGLRISYIDDASKSEIPTYAIIDGYNDDYSIISMNDKYLITYSIINNSLNIYEYKENTRFSVQLPHSQFNFAYSTDGYTNNNKLLYKRMYSDSQVIILYSYNESIIISLVSKSITILNLCVCLNNSDFIRYNYNSYTQVMYYQLGKVNRTKMYLRHHNEDTGSRTIALTSKNIYGVEIDQVTMFATVRINHYFYIRTEYINNANISNINRGANNNG